jgi:hypothetical protein
MSPRRSLYYSASKCEREEKNFLYFCSNLEKKVFFSSNFLVAMKVFESGNPNG